MLPRLLENLAWICSNNSIVSNEAIPRQLVEILEIMRARPDMTTRPEVIQALDDAQLILRPLLSCKCSGRCSKSCICDKGEKNTQDEEGTTIDGPWWHEEGCTLWCTCNCKKSGQGTEDEKDIADQTELIPAGVLRHGRKRSSVTEAGGLSKKVEKKRRR
jgi:hypothetical protein